MSVRESLALKMYVRWAEFRFVGVVVGLVAARVGRGAHVRRSASRSPSGILY